MDIAESEHEKAEHKSEHLNSWVAVAIAVLAAFVGICSIKAGNIVHSMEHEQALSIDAWDYYQAKNIRQDIYQSVADDMATRVKDSHLAPDSGAAKMQATYTKLGQKEDQEKGELKTEAQGHDQDYVKLSFHHDQFDLSGASCSLAIALFAVTALTKKRWLFFVALIPAAFGIVMGLSGLLGWRIHPDALINPLTFLSLR